MKNDKKRLIALAILTTTLLAGIVVLGYMMIIRSEVSTADLISMPVLLVLVVFIAFFIFRRYKDVSKGMPLEDERSKKVMNKAAAMSFFTTLYWLLALSLFQPFFAKLLFKAEYLDAEQTVGGAIFGMAILFAMYWFYYNRKGNIIN